MAYTSGSQFQAGLAPNPPPIFCMSLFVNTPDSDHQHIRSALRALTVFRLTCSLHRVHCSLLPEQGKSVVVYFTSEHSFMVCTARRLQAQMSAISNTVPLIYTILIHVLHTYMHFEWNTFDSNWNHGRISCDVHFAGHLRSKCAEQGGARTGIENRWFTHGMSSSGRAYQVVHKSQMSAFEVVGAFLIMRALASRLPPPLYAPATKHVCDKWRQKSFSTL